MFCGHHVYKATPCFLHNAAMAVLRAQEPWLCAQVFFLDSLKFFLSLYGHKLPVLSMDISGDSTLLVSGSADKNIKIWGLDFGDCHKSLFAHQDSVMQVKIVLIGALLLTAKTQHQSFTGLHAQAC